MNKRFSILSIAFNEYGVFDNKQKTRVAFNFNLKDKKNVEDYVSMLNKKYTK